MRIGLSAALICFCAGASAQEDARPPLTCFGVEPLWDLEIDDEGAAFHAPETPEILYAIPDVRDALGKAWPKALTLLAREDTAIAIIRPAQCSDGMSDRTYDWSVDMLTQRNGEAVILTGCCRTPEG